MRRPSPRRLMGFVAAFFRGVFRRFRRLWRIGRGFVAGALRSLVARLAGLWPGLSPPMWWLVGILLALTGISIVVYVITDVLDAWAPNVATSALTVVLAVVVVEAILRHERTERLRPRVENALWRIGVGFRMFTDDVVTDYAATHIETFQPIPREVEAALDLWLDGQHTEDEPREPLPGETLPTLLLTATEFAQSLRRVRDDDLDVIEPDLVRAFDAVGASVGLARGVYQRDAMGIGGGDPEPIALRLIVESTRRLAPILRRYDPAWLTMTDLSLRAAEAHREHFVRRRAEHRG